MSLKSTSREGFFEALRVAGMPEPPGRFSVTPEHQVISNAMLGEIASFIRVFDRVTGRDFWQEAARHGAALIARPVRREVCFFSAWDFHLPAEGGFELIEFNDNGSGFLFGEIINALFYEVAGLQHEKGIAPPAMISTFRQTIGGLVEREAIAFFGQRPAGQVLILDDLESLRRGKFRGELRLLRDLLRERNWRAELASPGQTHWDGQDLTFEGRPVAFIVNRSTDFLWRSDDFAALRKAYETGRVYVAPNPFTYVTRSDKQLLEWLSSPDWDENLGIDAGERRVLSAHVPVTHMLRADNMDVLAREKRNFVFKPLHGFAGRGLIDSAAVGRARLRRLLKVSDGYVAQKRIAKPYIEVDGIRLWNDLRVWAYRSEIFLISGRASRRPDRLDLTPPGGWLPTYASL